MRIIGLKRGTVQLVPHQKQWKRMFDEERKNLESVIGKYAIDIQHVGSSAIPGIQAKPIIDIAIAVKNIRVVQKMRFALLGIGYEYKGQHGIPGRRFFVKGTPRTHHIQVVKYNSRLWKDFMLFRDYLRKHKKTALDYQHLKSHLAIEFKNERQAYTKVKGKYCEKIVRLARLKAKVESKRR